MQQQGIDPAESNQPPLSPAELEKIIANRETDENIARLAKRLLEEWKAEPEPVQGTPDLSFAKFQEKLEEAKNQ